jgi:Xaa-Pro aminopeptidase
MFAEAVYQSRRAQLVKRLRTGLVLIPGHGPSPINFAANTYPFRQDSTFLYFGGPSRPGLFILMDCDANQSLLCGPEPVPEDQIWSGPAPALAELAAAAAFDRAVTPGDLGARLSAAREQSRPLHFLPPYRADQTLRLSELLERPPAQVAARASRALIDAVVEQRAVKSDVEVAEIEKALVICAAMFQAATATRLENQRPPTIAGRMAAVAASRGSTWAFAPIVTPHGDILHGGLPPDPLQEGDMLVVDVGAESPEGYASDITRTLPVGGRFDSRQRELYTIVLEAQRTAIDVIAPGRRFLDIHLTAATVICRGLKELGLMRGDVDAAVAEGAHALFFPHGLGHMLGLDAHDMEALGEDAVGYDDDVRRSEQFGLAALRLGRRLAPGFVVTVEPGIYFNTALIEQWRRERRAEAFVDYDRLAAFEGLGGIRIEDDVLVTAENARILGPTIPKSVANLEAALQ